MYCSSKCKREESRQGSLKNTNLLEITNWLRAIVFNYGTLENIELLIINLFIHTICILSWQFLQKNINCANRHLFGVQEIFIKCLNFRKITLDSQSLYPRLLGSTSTTVTSSAPRAVLHGSCQNLRDYPVRSWGELRPRPGISSSSCLCLQLSHYLPTNHRGRLN